VRGETGGGEKGETGQRAGRIPERGSERSRRYAPRISTSHLTLTERQCPRLDLFVGLLGVVRKPGAGKVIARNFMKCLVRL